MLSVASVFVALVLCSVTAITMGKEEASRERSRSDRVVRTYFDSLVDADYDTAHALPCTHETGVTKNEFVQWERADPIRSYEVQSSGGWSSLVDGHGRTYRVHVVRLSGVEFEGELRTQGSDPACVRYTLINA